jgi:soluble lytic murein transglycosylase
LPAFPPELLARESGLRLAEALYGVGLDEEAALAYAAVSPRITETRARRALGLRLVRVGRVKAAKAHVTCGSAQDAESRAIEREICHPRPHADLVGGLLRGTELDPFLPYAIMTAESAMNPSVTSAAGARGIMQIMPEVGARLHEARYPGRPFHAQDLYRSGYNALLGTTELLGLQSRFRELGVEEPLPLTIAAYNGGREAVERWLEASRRASRFEIDTFSEDISFTETRRYVRTVLGYLEAYHRAWGVHGTP